MVPAIGSFVTNPETATRFCLLAAQIGWTMDDSVESGGHGALSPLALASLQRVKLPTRSISLQLATSQSHLSKSRKAAGS